MFYFSHYQAALALTGWFQDLVLSYCSILYFDVILCSTIDCSALKCSVQMYTCNVKYKI